MSDRTETETEDGLRSAVRAFGWGVRGVAAGMGTVQGGGAGLSAVTPVATACLAVPVVGPLIAGGVALFGLVAGAVAGGAIGAALPSVLPFDID